MFISFSGCCVQCLVWFGAPQGSEGACLGADSFLSYSALTEFVSPSTYNPQYTQNCSSFFFSFILIPQSSTGSVDKSESRVCQRSGKKKNKKYINQNRKTEEEDIISHMKEDTKRGKPESTIKEKRMK